mmetsp:Transcript_20885/g.58966  ORF Transcript_20885/g.58966 Transcript_20885/m.58966 type:complete len:274 (-) Transcript_20885:246-1067(-)
MARTQRHQAQALQQWLDVLGGKLVLGSLLASFALGRRGRSALLLSALLLLALRLLALRLLALRLGLLPRLRPLRGRRRRTAGLRLHLRLLSSAEAPRAQPADGGHGARMGLGAERLYLHRPLRGVHQQGAKAAVLHAVGPELPRGTEAGTRHRRTQAAPKEPAVLPVLPVHEVHDPHGAVPAAHACKVRAVCAHAGYVATQAANPPLHLRHALAEAPEDHRAVHAGRGDVVAADGADAEDWPRVDRGGALHLALLRVPVLELPARAAKDHCAL